MIYYSDDSILIRDLIIDDAYIITEEEIKQGWHQSVDKYLNRIKDRDNGLCISMVIEYNGNIAGYINLYINSNNGPNSFHGLPEIVDFGVLEKYRNNGLGNKLMDVIETIAKKYSNKVYLAVGLHNGYGNAQRIYAKRGYIPDGTGVWYKDKICEPYTECSNDDDLIIYMSKEL